MKIEKVLVAGVKVMNEGRAEPETKAAYIVIALGLVQVVYAEKLTS